MKEYKVSAGVRTHSGEGKWFEDNDLNHSAMDAPNFVWKDYVGVGNDLGSKLQMEIFKKMYNSSKHHARVV
jgi:hypothetical protein